MRINFDDSDFKRNIDRLLAMIPERRNKAVHDVAEEILRLSSFEVPHNIGTLQNSGAVEPPGPAEEAIVGYNTEYAARLHEHPEYRFQKGRKGKYLEDPIKHNLLAFKKYFEDIFKQ